MTKTVHSNKNEKEIKIPSSMHSIQKTVQPDLFKEAPDIALCSKQFRSLSCILINKLAETEEDIEIELKYLDSIRRNNDYSKVSQKKVKKQLNKKQYECKTMSRLLELAEQEDRSLFLRKINTILTDHYVKDIKVKGLLENMQIICLRQITTMKKPKNYDNEKDAKEKIKSIRENYETHELVHGGKIYYSYLNFYKLNIALLPETNLKKKLQILKDVNREKYNKIPIMPLFLEPDFIKNIIEIIDAKKGWPRPKSDPIDLFSRIDSRNKIQELPFPKS